MHGSHLNQHHQGGHEQAGVHGNHQKGLMCMAGGRAPHIPHSLAMEGGARRRRRRAVVVGPSCHQGSVGPCVCFHPGW